MSPIRKAKKARGFYRNSRIEGLNGVNRLATKSEKYSTDYRQNKEKITD